MAKGGPNHTQVGSCKKCMETVEGCFSGKKHSQECASANSHRQVHLGMESSQLIGLRAAQKRSGVG